MGMLKRYYNYIVGVSYLFKTGREIGVGDRLPKGVKFSDLDSSAVYASRKALESFGIIRKL
jgi:hypothetical protein